MILVILLWRKKSKEVRKVTECVRIFEPLIVCCYHLQATLYRPELIREEIIIEGTIDAT